MERIKIVEKLEMQSCRELGTEAVFTISSAKPGNGVEQLRDNNLETYWQSDGAFPHFVTIQFLKKMSVSHLCVYLDYSADESYTAKKMVVSSGTCAHDLVDIQIMELNEPTGWVVIELIDPIFIISGQTQGIVRTHMLQLRILSMHQNGKDTHIRQIKLFGPRESTKIMAGFTLDNFKTVEMQQYSSIR